MAAQKRGEARRQDFRAVEATPGIFRTVLAYDKELMLCHFTMKKGTVTEPHTHTPAQIGYLMRGRVRFHRGDSDSFVVEPGGSYVFDPHEKHFVEVLEEARDETLGRMFYHLDSCVHDNRRTLPCPI